VSLRLAQYAIAMILTSLGLIVETVHPVRAAQQLFCAGQMNNGWSHTAEFLDGRFTQIRWERSGQPPQVSSLTFAATNEQGQPIYRGTFQAATAVTLVDLSKGNVQPGSQTSVGVEEWGWSRGNCGTSSGSTRALIPIASVQRN
jgi:hypothetical protein